MLFQAQSRYIVCVGSKVANFNTKGFFETDDKDIIKVLSNNPAIKIVGEVKSDVRSTPVTDPEEVTAVVVDEELIELKKSFFEKFNKEVPNNKKNDKEWIEKKLSE